MIYFFLQRHGVQNIMKRQLKVITHIIVVDQNLIKEPDQIEGVFQYFSNVICQKVLRFFKSYDTGILWIKLCKHYTGLKEDLFVCLTYIPPENSSIHKSHDFDFYGTIDEDVVRYSSIGKIFLCGDLKSRTGNKSDYVETCNLERYIDTVPNDLYEDNVDVRVSEDNTTNVYGDRLLHLCKETGLRIVNGRLCEDKGKGKFTCFNYFGSSVVDYLLTNYADFPIINTFNVGDIT